MISSLYSFIIFFCGWNDVGVCQNVQNIRNQFATSEYYENLRMVTSSENFATIFYLSRARAQMECANLCSRNGTCEAFNLYEIDTSFVCELIADNLCLNSTGKAFMYWPESTVWDKLRTGVKKSCFETRFPTLIDVACESMRPGCLGLWPNCHSCTETCIDCNSRYNFTGYGICIMWPEGNTPWSIPIFGRCYLNNTYLFRRDVDVTTGRTTGYYRMSFPDMNRLYNLNAYSYIKFSFIGTNAQYLYVYYNNSYVDADGRLVNMTWSRSWPSSVPDFFHVNQNGMLPTPFIEVTDDRYNCGSFWLLDPQNASYCPGGNISMFGNPNIVNGKVISTGMNCPSFAPGTLTAVTALEFI